MVEICTAPRALPGESSDPASDDGNLPLLVTAPRLLTEADIPWLFPLFKKRYTNYPYDPITCEGWFRNRVLKEPMLFLPQRTDRAFCISMLSVTPWIPANYETNVLIICAEDNAIWESIRLLHASIEWARLRRCTMWRMSSDTDHDVSILARRMGATEISPRYELRL